METLKKWAYIYSPCVISMILALIGIVASFFDLKESNGYSAILIMLLLPAFLILFVVDRVVKRLIKEAGRLWLIQIIFLLAAFGILYLVEL